jgi:Heterokaryon incompatibility protein Het-C
MYQWPQMDFHGDQTCLLRVSRTKLLRPRLAHADYILCRNWLRDYSQAMDVGALKKAHPETIRILVWLLSFLSFGYSTAEFEVTSDRLGVYRPEEHIE